MFVIIRKKILARKKNVLLVLCLVLFRGFDYRLTSGLPRIRIRKFIGALASMGIFVARLGLYT